MERAFGVELDGGLVLPFGFAATMVLLSVPYRLGADAAVTTPLMAVPLAAGFWLGRARLRASLPARRPRLPCWRRSSCSHRARRS